MKSIVKIVLVDLALGIVAIFAFSKGGLALSVQSTNTMTQSLALTVMALLAAAFGYAHYKLLSPKKAIRAIEARSVTVADYIGELKKLKHSRPYAAAEIQAAEEQYADFVGKVEALSEVSRINDNGFLDQLIPCCKETEACLKESFRQMLTRLLILGTRDEKRYRGETCGYIQANALRRNADALDRFYVLLTEVSRMRDKDMNAQLETMSTISALRASRGAGAPNLMDMQTQNAAADDANDA